MYICNMYVHVFMYIIYIYTLLSNMGKWRKIKVKQIAERNKNRDNRVWKAAYNVQNL